MKWIIRLLKILSYHERIIPDRIYKRLKYLTRWYLIGRRKHLIACLVLHEFHRSDPTVRHCHPFPFLSLVLTGGYWEEMDDGCWYWRAPGTILFRWASTRHRIILDPTVSGPIYTLVLLGPRIKKTWGFHTPTGFVAHDHYRGGQ